MSSKHLRKAILRYEMKADGEIDDDEPGCTDVFDEEPGAKGCCYICHINHGVTLLGGIELVVVGTLLYLTMYRVVMAVVTDGAATEHCSVTSGLVESCQLFNATLPGSDPVRTVLVTADFIAGGLLLLCVVAIVLLFVGVCRRHPLLLLPHLALQLVLLVFSTWHFFLYAWNYFYGQLYRQRRQFRWTHALERLWLSSIFLLVTLFEVYFFYVVVCCCVYMRRTKSVNRRFQQHLTEFCQRRWSEVAKRLDEERRRREQEAAKRRSNERQHISA